ncbi:MAG: gliding motility-associated C-terminal domain-containing protein [Bacteroidetes bacterium]|nr:gliding motility-associated C-terminal domain-containing protein [Bacteroidota bacterium]
MQNIYLTKINKWRRGLFLLLSVFLLGMAGVNAQSSKIRVGPNILCFGQQTVFTFDLVSINPMDVQSYTIRFGNGDSTVLNKPSITGGPVTNSYNYVYKSAGVYNITGITKTKTSGSYTSSWIDTVYNLPVVAYKTITLDSQCLANNFNGFTNLSIKHPSFPSNGLASSYWVFGDGNTLSDMSDTVFHRYALYGSFAVSLQVSDSLGCISSVAAVDRKRVYIAPNVKSHFTVEGKASCNYSTYTFLNQSNIAPNQVKSFKWYFGDDSVYVSSNPATQQEVNAYLGAKFLYTYQKEGRFNPSLVIFDKRSVCSDSFSVSMDPSQVWPENIVIRIDIQVRRNDTYDNSEYGGDSVCLAAPDAASVFMYNTYPLRGQGATDIHFTWNYNDPNQKQPPLCYKDDQNPADPYKYQGTGQFYPFLVLYCPNQPADTFYYFSRIDSVQDPKYSQFNQAGLAGVNVDWAVPPKLNTVYARHLNPMISKDPSKDGGLYLFKNLYNTIDTIVRYYPGGAIKDSVYQPRYVYGKDWSKTQFEKDSLKFYYMPLDSVMPFHFFTSDQSDTVNHVDFKNPKTGKDTTLWGVAINQTVAINYRGIPTFKYFFFNGDTIVDYVSHNGVVDYNNLVGYGLNILGPSVAIESPPTVVIPTWQKNQCGPTYPVYFTNASTVYQSEHLYIKWDFGDTKWAPQCTSYSTPQLYPPTNGVRKYTSAVDLLNRSEGHFIVNGRAYDGRLTQCQFSHDTLPSHPYVNWETLYNWHLNGHDFPPYDTTKWTIGYTKWPTNEIAPTGKNWVQPMDTPSWNKPMFAFPTRIDTITNMWPTDLNPNVPITTNAPIPDPIAAALGAPFYRENGVVKYYTIPAGTRFDTSTFVTITDPLDTLPNGSLRRYRGKQKIPGTKMTLYRYIFNRVITQCITVKLFMQDSSNNATEAADSFLVDEKGIVRKLYAIKSKLTGRDSIFKYVDDTLLSKFDCNGSANLQLPMMKSDAWGLGKNKAGKECPGLDLGPHTGVGFELANTISGKTAPSCGRSFLLFNYDSLFDRNDNTPCVLDGFIPFGGASAGGYGYPPYNNSGQFNPNTVWQSINDGGAAGTNWTHYQSPFNTGFSHMGALAAQRDGFITVGLIIGNGCNGTDCSKPDPDCLTDTIWYHNFIQILGLDAAFEVLPATKVNPNVYFCSNLLRGRGDTVTVVPTYPIQKFMLTDHWIWGDGMETIDSFFVIGEQTTPVPVARKRYTIDNQDPAFPKTYLDSVFDVGKHVRIDLRIDTTWQCGDGQHRLPPQKIDTLKMIYDSAFFVGPLKHKYNLTSFEMKDPNSLAADGRRWEGTPIQRILTAQNGCARGYQKSVIIGIIDTFYVSDTLVCLGEEVQFVDYVRYWLPYVCNYRPDICPDTAVNPNCPGSPYPSIRSYDDWRYASYGYPIDTFKTFGSPPTFWTDPVTGLQRTYFQERIYWDWESDGVTDANMVQVPKHKFTKAGKYKVSMITRDSAGYWDTCFRYIYVMEPRPKFTSKNNTLQFNCRDTVQLFDSSIAYPQTTGPDSCMKADGSPCDQITDVFWWFGDRKKTPFNYQSIIRNPIYDYRQNGKYLVQLAVYTEQGCTDTINQEIFINGPRPKIKLLSDSVGCVPYTVRVLSTPDIDKREPKDTATQLTIVQSGNQYRDQSRLEWSKNQQTNFTYDKPGIYYITASGIDNIDAGNASCPIVNVPDTFFGTQPPIRVYVVAPPDVKIQTSKQRMCVGDIFKIRNKSDFDSINRFTFDIWDSAYTKKIDSLLKTSYLGDSSFQYRFTERGTYNIVGSSSRFIRSLGLTSPEAIKSCERSDTVTVFTTSTKADFRIDTSATKGIFTFVNLSDKTLTDEYTWTIYAPNGSLKSPLIDDKKHFISNPLVLHRSDSLNLNLVNMDFADDIGTFNICLKASTQNPSCPDSICKTVYNNVEFKIYIPNVFTPGNDGLNDDLKVDIKGYDKFEMLIYNRWGTKVFECTDPNVKWNGKSFNDGSECAEGVYYYVLTYRFRGHGEQQARGSVTLIR